MALANLLVRIGADTRDFEEGMARVSREIGQAVTFSDRLASGFNRLGDRLTDIGTRLTIGITAPLAAFATAVTSASANMDALQRGLRAVSSSSGEASRMLEQLREVAKLPGLGFKEAVQGAVNLRAVGFSAKETIEILTQFGNALATVGRGRGDLEEVIRQLGQLASRGKVTADNLKPILERVPQVAAIIKNAFGTIDTEALQKAEVSADKFIKVLIKGLEELPRVTGGLKNEIENLRDSVNIAMSKMGDAIAPFAESALRALTPLLDAAVQVADAFRRLPQPVQTATVALVAAFAAVGPLNLAIGQIVKTFGLLESIVLRLGPALMGIAAGGFTALASAISNVAVAVATGMTGALTGLELKILAIGKAASLAAAAFIGWHLGRWIDENIVSRFPALDRFLQKLADIPGALVARVTGATQQANAATAQFGQSVEMLEKKLAAQGIVIERGGMSLEEYSRKLRDAARAAGDKVKVTDQVSQKFRVVSNDAEVLARWLEQVRRSFEEAEEAFRGMSGVDAWIQMNQNLDTLEAKWMRTIDLAKVWRDEGVASIMAAQGAMEAMLPPLDQIGPKIQEIGRGMALLGQQATGVFDASIAGLERFGAQVTSLPPLLQKMTDEQFADISKKSKKFFDDQDKLWGTFQRQVSTIITDLGKGLADVILKGGSLKDVMVGALREIGNAIMRLVTEQISGALVKALNDIIHGKIPSLMKGFSDLTKAIGGFAKAVTEAFGGSTAGTAAGAATGAGTGAAGAGGLSGIGGVLSLVTGAVQAVFGALSFFQGRRMEQDIGRIEVTTRGILNQLVSLQESANKWWPWMQEATLVLWKIFAALAQVNLGVGGKNLGEQLAETADEARQATRQLEHLSVAVGSVTPVVADIATPVEDLSNAVQDATGSVANLAETTTRASGSVSASLNQLAGVAESTSRRVSSSLGALAGISASRPVDVGVTPTGTTTGSSGRPGGITIRLEGGSARDREFAANVVGQMIHGLKLSGQLI